MASAVDVVLLTWFALQFPVGLGAYAGGGPLVGALSLLALAVFFLLVLAVARLFDR